MVFLRLFHLHLSPQLMLLLFIILYFFFRCWFSCWRHFIAFLHQDVKELQVIYTVHVPMKGYPQYVILVYQHCTYVLNGSLHSDQIYPNEEQNHLVNETHEYEYPSNLRIHCRRLMMVDVYIYMLRTAGLFETVFLLPMQGMLKQNPSNGITLFAGIMIWTGKSYSQNQKDKETELRKRGTKSIQIKLPLIHLGIPAYWFI